MSGSTFFCDYQSLRIPDVFKRAKALDLRALPTGDDNFYKNVSRQTAVASLKTILSYAKNCFLLIRDKKFGTRKYSLITQVHVARRRMWLCARSHLSMSKRCSLFSCVFFHFMFINCKNPDLKLKQWIFIYIWTSTFLLCLHPRPFVMSLRLYDF